MSDTKKFLVSMAMFISAFVASDAAAESLYDIDCKIRDTRHRIEKLRQARDVMVAHDLRKNRNWRIVSERAEQINELRAENERYLDEVCNFLKKECHIWPVARTPFVFVQYSSKYTYVDVRRSLYESNKRKIQAYETLAKEVNDYSLHIKNYHDSIMYSEIGKCQLKIDSLLDRKIQLTR